MKVKYTHGTEVLRFCASLRKIKLDHAVLEKLGRIIAAGIINNIKTQKQSDGSALKVNAQSTLDRKEEKGRPLLSLVDQFRRLVRGRGHSWAVNVDPAREDVAIEPATKEVENITDWVQRKGYVGWFSISKGALRRMKRIVHDEIQEKVKKARP